jgi:hypothetical protein
VGGALGSPVGALDGLVGSLVGSPEGCDVGDLQVAYIRRTRSSPVLVSRREASGSIQTKPKGLFREGAAESNVIVVTCRVDRTRRRSLSLLLSEM